MKHITLDLSTDVNHGQAEEAARAPAAGILEKCSLLAWYDNAKKTGAPSEACALENWKCVRDYAQHHEADVRVSVNGDAFEFYFVRTPSGTARLKKKHVQEVHTGLAVDTDDNVQGG